MLCARNLAAASSCRQAAPPCASSSAARLLSATTTTCSPSCSAAAAGPSSHANTQRRNAIAGARAVPVSRRRLAVVCMAHPRRVAKVAAQIQRELGVMLIQDQVVINALSPERRTGLDNQLSVVPSITHVYVSNDLQVVKVYISIYSDDYGKKRAMANLKRLEPYVRREMGQRVPLRLTPEYRFEYDDTLDEMELVEKVIGEADVARYKRELAEEYGEEEEELEPPSSDNSPTELDAVGSEGPGKRDKKKKKKSQGVDDDEGFFQEYRDFDTESRTQFFNRKGPFDDLFSGDGDELVQSVSSPIPAPGSEGSRRKGKRR